MKKKPFFLLLAVIVCAAGAYLGWQYYVDGNRQSLTLYGNVDIRTVNLNFRVGGRLAELRVDEGDSVNVGDVLGRLDDAPYRIAVAQAKANAEALKAKASTDAGRLSCRRNCSGQGRRCPESV